MMKESAQTRYLSLSADRTAFLDEARDCAKVTLPYLLTDDGLSKGERLPIPWQSVGSKGCNALASKLMNSLFPINTSFFKLQIVDSELEKLPEVTPEIRSEIDLSLAKMERMIIQEIAESSDRVQLHSAMKHLIVTGNVLLYAGKKNLKVYPLERYVVCRDGDGNLVEVVTRESIHRSMLPAKFQRVMAKGKDVNSPGEDGPKYGMAGESTVDDATVYTHARLKDGHWEWHQEIDGEIVDGSHSRAPQNITPWICLTFNKVEAEEYGRSRVSEFLGDLRSLEGLMEALVTASAISAKCVFMVAPSASLKPQSLARASSGSIIVGRPDDVSVVQTNKSQDMRSVIEMIRDLTTRLSDAFLILNPRKSERTTATELQILKQELDEQLGGLWTSLTQALLQPYLARKLHVMTRSKKLPSLPKNLVAPTIVAGLGSVGRGQDRAALMEFISTVSQGLGPEALTQFINPLELMKRLAAASGIDTLNLIKDPATMEAEQQQAQQQMMQQQMMGQMGQLAKSPMAERLMNDYAEQAQQPGGPAPQESTPPDPLAQG